MQGREGAWRRGQSGDGERSHSRGTQTCDVSTAGCAMLRFCRAAARHALRPARLASPLSHACNGIPGPRGGSGGLPTPHSLVAARQLSARVGRLQFLDVSRDLHKPKRPDLVPAGYVAKFQSGGSGGTAAGTLEFAPDVLEHLRWLAQKDALRQGMWHTCVRGAAGSGVTCAGCVWWVLLHNQSVPSLSAGHSLCLFYSLPLSLSVFVSLFQHPHPPPSTHTHFADMFLMGTPGPARRRLALLYCSLLGREAEYVAISRDTTDSDLKQRREISGGTSSFVDQAPVRAALNVRGTDTHTHTHLFLTCAHPPLLRCAPFAVVTPVHY